MTNKVMISKEQHCSNKNHKKIIQKVNDVKFFLENYPKACSKIDIDYANHILSDLLQSILTAIDNAEEDQRIKDLF